MMGNCLSVCWWVFRSCWERWSRLLKLKQNRPNPLSRGLHDEDSQVLFMLRTLHQQHRMHGDVNIYEVLFYISEKAVFAKVRCNLCGGESMCFVSRDNSWLSKVTGLKLSHISWWNMMFSAGRNLCKCFQMLSSCSFLYCMNLQHLHIICPP